METKNKKKNSIWANVLRLWGDLKKEISHMQFPTESIIQHTTITVILVGLFFGVYIFFADWLIITFFSKVLKYGII